MEESGAPIRLREAGVGVVIGGILLIVTATASTAAIGAVATVLLGIFYITVGPDIVDPRRVGLAIALVGAIGLIEASQYGIGFEPMVIGFFAIAFGMFDIVFGLVFSRIRHRQS